MLKNLIDILLCPACASSQLELHEFEVSSSDAVRDGVVRCAACNAWYPIEEALLEFLTGDLAYREDRSRFWAKHEPKLSALGLAPDHAQSSGSDQHLQTIQQQHFDWYAQNDQQTYSSYEQRPFWLAVDQLTFGKWRQMIQSSKWLLDIGCAQGRSTFKVMHMPINVVGFDISKHLVRQAIERYRRQSYPAKATFFVADASRLPFREEVFDYVLIYGVLHHVPQPAQTCREVARVLKHTGIYFGSENNTTIFRGLFDLLQRLRPQWHEEAGPEALLSANWFSQAFQGTHVRLETESIVFIPPHLANLLPEEVALRLVRLSNAAGQAIPIIKSNGGLINVIGRKS